MPVGETSGAGRGGGMKPIVLKLSDNVTIIIGDCRDVLPVECDAVVTDPPYGVKMLRGDSRVKGRIVGDETPPDLRWVAAFPAVVWGGNNFCDQLPRSTGWLVWFKYAADVSEHSQAELAWTNGCRTIRHYAEQFTGFMRQREGQCHPTQKPINLMVWAMRQAKVPEGATVLDPYMGSGTTGVACIRTGRKFIGVEIDPTHFETARQRLTAELAQCRLALKYQETGEQ